MVSRKVESDKRGGIHIRWEDASSEKTELIYSIFVYVFHDECGIKIKGKNHIKRNACNMQKGKEKYEKPEKQKTIMEGRGGAILKCIACSIRISIISASESGGLRGRSAGR